MGVVCARLHVRVSCACYAAKLLQRFPHTTLACQAASDHIPHIGPQHSTLHMQHNTAELCSSSRCCCYIARGQLDKATKRAKQRFRQLVGHTHIHTSFWVHISQHHLQHCHATAALVSFFPAWYTTQTRPAPLPIATVGAPQPHE